MSLSHLISSICLAGADSEPAGGGEMKQFIIMMVVILGALWFMILRPQKREREQKKAMLDGVKKGDKIVTIGGIHGWVTEVDKAGKTLSVRVDTKTTMKMNRTAISVIDSGDAEEKES